jgi:hypothetical protein
MIPNSGIGMLEGKAVNLGSYDNWLAYRRNEPLLRASEYLLYTDSHLTGEVPTGTEPYQFFNLVPVDIRAGRVRTAVALRVGVYVEFGVSRIDKTDQSRYHGGTMSDEIAALASLTCGARFRSSGETRIFGVTGDPKGRPIAWDARPEPVLNIDVRRLVLPRAAASHPIMPIRNLERFPSFSPEQAICLIRSARLYQDSLWLAESEPSLTWLLMVAAVETAANYWRSSKDNPLERLSESRPDFVGNLRSVGGDDLASLVAEEFSDSIGATKKFVEFLLEYLPDPPENRPTDWAQVEWSEENLKKAFRVIYRFRSKALHDGMPFPAPMCEPPYRDHQWEAPAEKPLGGTTYSYGGTWLSKDTPMNLHTFEYIARNAINSWWLSMTNTAATIA